MYNSHEYLTRRTCIKAIIIGSNFTANHINKLGYTQALLETLPVEYTIMETIVKVVMMLTLATAAAAADVNPNQFTCTTESPVQAPQFSNTNP